MKKHLVYRRTEDPDCFGDTIDLDGMSLEEIKHNPIILYNHDYNLTPVGKIERVFVDEQGLWVIPEEIFDPAVKKKIAAGELKFTLGFTVNAHGNNKHGGNHFIRTTMLEVSVTEADKAVQGGEGKREPD